MEVSRAATSATAAKKRKAGSADGESVELPSSYDVAQHKRPRRRVVVVSSAPKIKSEAESVRTSNDGFWTSDHAESSCCSSNGSSELEDESDQVESWTYNSSRDESRREMTAPTSKVGAEAESTARLKDESQRRSPTVVNASEIEEFFAAMEKESQQKFKEKYNFDVAKDEPHEGRYEWVRLKP